MTFAVINAPFSSSLGDIRINQGTYLDTVVADSGVFHANGIDAAALDFALGKNISVLAMASGYVEYVYDASADGSGGSHSFGNYVTIRHEVTPIDGGEKIVFFATYAHLDQTSLEQLKFAFDVWESLHLEMPVSAGDTIGAVGDAGYPVPHLHVQFSTSLTNSMPFNPQFADGNISVANTSLLNSLMLSGSVYGPGGLTLAELTEGDSVRSLNSDTGEIPGQFTPGGIGGGGEPDLMVSNVGLNLSGASPGADVEVSFTLRNLGEVSSVTARAQIVISTNSDFSGTVRVLEEFNVGGLDPLGTTAAIKDYLRTITLPIDLGRTTYYVGVRVDTNNDLVESDESNNVASSTGLAVGGGLSGEPDLRIVSPSIPGVTFQPGTSIPLTFQIAADSDGSPAYTYRIYYSSDSTFGATDKLLYEQTTDRGLGFVGVHYYSLNLALPDDAIQGTGHIFIQVDPFNALAEQKEDNNLRSVGITISSDIADADALPDIYADELTIDPVLEVGGQFRFSPGQVNLSSDDAILTQSFGDGTYGYKISLVMSVDSIISADDRVIYATGVSALAAGQSTDIGFIITLPTDIEAGFYYFGSVLDYAQQVAEESETNNITDPVRVEVINNIPKSIDAIEDVIVISGKGLSTGNVFGNDIFQLFSSPFVDKISGSSSLVGIEFLLPSGAKVTIHADGSYVIDAESVLANMAPGANVIDTLTYRAVGVNGDVETATVQVILQRSDPNVGTTENDNLFGTVWADLINGLGGNDSISGFEGNDKLFGSTGADRMTGGTGNDLVVGGTGSDKLFAQGGRDIVDGGRGNDFLSGGGGADHFVFRALDGHDTIADYTDGLDKIDVRKHAVVSVFDDLTIADSANGAIVSIGIDTIIIKGILASQLDESDFLI